MSFKVTFPKLGRTATFSTDVQPSDDDIEEVYHSMLSEPGETTLGVTKALGRGTETALGAGLGGGTELAGKALTQVKDIPVQPVPLGPKVDIPLPGFIKQSLQDVGGAISGVGKTFKDKLYTMANTGWEAPDAQVTWKQHPIRKFLESTAEATPPMVGAMATTAITKNPIAGASLFFPIIASQYFDEATKAGVPEDRALKGAMVDGLVQTALETIPLTGWMKGGPALKRIVRGMVQEGLLEEGSQQLFENSLKIAEWKSKQPGYTAEQFRADLTQGVGESILVGAGLGAGMGSWKIQNAEDFKYELKKMLDADTTLDSEQKAYYYSTMMADAGLGDKQTEMELGQLEGKPTVNQAQMNLVQKAGYNFEEYVARPTDPAELAKYNQKMEATSKIASAVQSGMLPEDTAIKMLRDIVKVVKPATAGTGSTKTELFTPEELVTKRTLKQDTSDYTVKLARKTVYKSKFWQKGKGLVRISSSEQLADLANYILDTWNKGGKETSPWMDEVVFHHDSWKHPIAAHTTGSGNIKPLGWHCSLQALPATNQIQITINAYNQERSNLEIFSFW